MTKYEYELKIDIDKKMRYTELTTMLCHKTDAIRKHFNMESINAFEIYRTHKGYHIYILLISNKRITDHNIITQQLIYGSDPLREIHNMERIDNGIREWNVLFRRKYRLVCIGEKFKLGKRLSEERHVGNFIY